MASTHWEWACDLRDRDKGKAKQEFFIPTAQNGSPHTAPRLQIAARSGRARQPRAREIEPRRSTQHGAHGRAGEGGRRGSGERVRRGGQTFVEYYYQTFDANRGALATLYGGTSVLSFEGHRVAGAAEIGLKLAQLPFEQCRHSICTIDCQPTPSFPGGILVFVSGNLQLAGEEHQLRFSQMFQLVPNEQGSFFVQNDIFRLNYG